MKVVDQPAYCLHRRLYSESSLILECLTRDFGRISVLAKGAKKRKNQSVFLPFQALQINFSGKSDLKTLTSIECESFTLQPKSNLAALYANELILKLIPKGEGAEDIFNIYQQLLHRLSDDNLEQPLRVFEMELLSLMGLLPDFYSDCETDEAIHSEQFYDYYPQRGFIRRNDSNGLAGDAIQQIQSRTFESSLALSAAKKIMRQTIQCQLNGQELKTRKLFHQLFMTHSS